MSEQVSRNNRNVKFVLKENKPRIQNVYIDMNEGNKVHFNHLSQIYTQKNYIFIRHFFSFLTYSSYFSSLDSFLLFFFFCSSCSHRKMVANLSRTIYLTFLLSNGAQAKRKENEMREQSGAKFKRIVAIDF